MQSSRTLSFWILVGLMLLVSLSRAAHSSELPLDNDEIWEVWQTFGTPEQIIQWTSPTEYPTYMLMLGGWKEIVGFHPIVLRYFSALLALPALALMYRAVRRSKGEWSALLAALAYSAVPIGLYTGLMTRSYVIAFTALPVTFWWSSRYFERPTFWRGLVLGLSLYALYIGTVTIIPALPLFALYILLTYPKQSWRGLYPAAIGLALSLPDYLANKRAFTGGFGAVEQMIRPASLPQGWFDFFQFYTLNPLWYLVLAVALAAGLYAVWRPTRQGERLWMLFWISWVIAVPVILHILQPRLGFYPPRRYAWWYTFGFALLVGASSVYLPRLVRYASSGLLVALLLFAPSLRDYAYIVTPLGENLRWLRDHAQADDALLLDPAITCNFAEEWDYYTRLYFPQGLRYVNEPEGRPRLWYVASQNDASREVEAQLARTRVPGRFVGPPGCIFRLYEAPPNSEGILYENGLRFHGFQIMEGERPLNFPLVFRDRQPIRLRLWWSVDQPISLDYSISLGFNRPDSPGSQSDSAPQLIYPEGAPAETSQWMPGQIYVEERTFSAPASNFRHQFRLSLVVYWFGQPDQRFAAPGVSEDGSLPLTEVTVVAW